jgi:hypothetical protein
LNNVLCFISGKPEEAEDIEIEDIDLVIEEPDVIIVKVRFSVFYITNLDLLLIRRKPKS